ncbi:MAG TPA: hypothetical protein VMU34_06080 [Mycobacterium sp.]|nr:hypothetical protein [Mycobacterium sp.]
METPSDQVDIAPLQTRSLRWTHARGEEQMQKRVIRRMWEKPHSAGSFAGTEAEILRAEPVQDSLLLLECERVRRWRVPTWPLQPREEIPRDQLVDSSLRNHRTETASNDVLDVLHGPLLGGAVLEQHFLLQEFSLEAPHIAGPQF